MVPTIRQPAPPRARPSAATPAAAARRRAGSSRARRGRAVAAVALAILAIGAGAAGALYASLPGVADAGHRVAALLGHRERVAASALPRRVSEAVVAVEDERYWHHGAVDPLAIGRTLVDGIAHPGRDPGGSTIAQQLAKQLYPEGGGVTPAVLRSIGLAFKLEQRYSKAQILAMYLNSVYLGHGHRGVADASRGYFATAADRLTWGEASLLAGLPQAPSADDPVLHFARARIRQRAVLRQLVANGDLTPAQAAAAYRHTPRPRRASRGAARAGT